MEDQIKHDVKINDNCIMRLRNNINTGYWSIFYYNSEASFHNLYGPAVNHNNRTKMWYVNGIRHRENQPAFISPLGELWYYNGKLHRINGPAKLLYKYNNKLKKVTINRKYYYINGDKLNYNKYYKILTLFKKKTNLFLTKKRLLISSSLNNNHNLYKDKNLCNLISSYI